MKEKASGNKGSGVPVFLLTTALTVSVVSAVFAAAAFFIFVPFLNLAAAVVLAPSACVLLYRVFGGNAGMTAPVRRAVTGVVSAWGAYLYICVTMGIVAAVYGSEPLILDEMRAFGVMDVIEQLSNGYFNAAAYIAAPWLLWQDLAGRGEALWNGLAVAAVFAQIGIPQLFIKEQGE